MDSKPVASCPWCGSHPDVVGCRVECSNPFCEAQPNTAGQSEAEAIGAWNRRAAPPSDAAMTALKERCDSAEQCMLMLTADHNSGPHYVRGFDMANKHFGTYTEPASARHSADNASPVSNEKESDTALLRQDAERYRWLRDEENGDSDLCPFVAGDTLDAAIDAAMKSTAPGSADNASPRSDEKESPPPPVDQGEQHG